MDLSELTREIVIPIGNQALTVEYSPDAYSPTALEELRKEGDGAIKLAPYLSRMIVRWDMTRRGEPIPLTVEALNGVNQVILAAIDRAIDADLKAFGAALSATSSDSEAD